MPRIATLLFAVLGVVAATPGRSAEPPAAVASAALSGCAKPTPTRPPSPRPAAGPAPADVHVTVVCEAPHLASAASTARSGSASEPKPPPALPTPAARPAELGASAPITENPVGVIDWLRVISALAALALLVVGLRVLLHALDVRLLAREPERVRSTGNVASALPAEAFIFRRHWGSFGGESTGWNMSARLARLLSGALLVTSAVAMLMLLLHVDDGSVKRPTPTANGPVKAEKAQK